MSMGKELQSELVFFKYLLCASLAHVILIAPCEVGALIISILQLRKQRQRD